MSRRYPKGITRRAKGWRLSVTVHGQLHQRSFPPATSLEDVEKELYEFRKTLRAGTTDQPAGTLGADITRYLDTHFGQRPGRAERERHLNLWKAELGELTWRARLTKDDVAKVLTTWRNTLSADTCNKRRAALLAMFNALDGKGGPNPVRAIPKYRVTPPLARGLPFPLIAKALKSLPRCKTRARLKLMAYTGARPIQIARITPEDWDDKRQTLLLRATDKGAGTKPHVVPLSTEAQAALREFENTNAWGKFASAPMGRIWKAAAVAAGLPQDTRVYDLRHSFGTAIYRATGDLSITKELLGHASLKMTERYTMAAIPERQTLAIAAFNDAIGRKRSGKHSGKFRHRSVVSSRPSKRR